MSRPRYTDADGEVWVGASDIADLLSLDPRTVTVWANKGRIPCQRVLGSHRRYPLHRIEAMADSLRAEKWARRPTPETAP